MLNKKYIALASVAFALASCSSDDVSTGFSADRGDSVANLDNGAKSTALWRAFDKEGVSEYLTVFNEKHQDKPFNVARRDEISSCSDKALKMDDGTIYMDELESLFMEGSLVDGVCGKALSLMSGEVAPLGVNLLDSMKTGTVEFWFRPGDDFYDESARTLLGNDEARMHFFVKDGNLIFQKNHADKHYFVKGAVEFKNDWNLIGGQWGDGYLSLWLNGKLVARIEHDMGYAPSLRGVPYGNLVVIGFKSNCCMEGPSQYESMTTSGDFDQFRISKVLRYDNGVKENSSENEETVENNEPIVEENPVEIYIDTINALSETSEFSSCSDKALKFDEETLYLDEMDTVLNEGTLVQGVCGAAVRVKVGEKAKTSISLDENLDVGTVEFWFRPGEDFYDESSRTILGNDEARVHFFMQNGKLVFQKNHADRHFFVKGDVEFKNDWNLIAGQWGDGFLSLWVNGKLVARIEHNLGYEHSARGYIDGNLIVAGQKSACCMEGPGQYSSMTTSGDFDQVRVSKTTRYENGSDIDACSEKALKFDEGTLFLDEMDSVLYEGKLVQGVCGSAVRVKPGEKAKTSISLDDALDVGTVEFWFRPGEDFYDESSRTILGNDEARVHFFMQKGKLVFQKNHADRHYYVKGDVELKDDWNLIAGQWGDGFLSLWVNGELVDISSHDEGYEPSARGYTDGNLIVAGQKSACCMEGPGQYSSMTTSGDFDQVRVSNVLRYTRGVSEAVSDPSDEQVVESEDDVVTIAEE